LFARYRVKLVADPHELVESQVTNEVCIMEFGAKQVADRFKLCRHVEIART